MINQQQSSSAPSLDNLSYGDEMLQRAFDSMAQQEQQSQDQTLFRPTIRPGIGDKRMFYQNIMAAPQDQTAEPMSGAAPDQQVGQAPAQGDTQSLFGQKSGYKFGVKTFYNDFHIGTDKIVPVGTPIYAPTSGKVVSTVNGKEGGNTIQFVDSNGKLWRFLHLSKFASKGGEEVKPGQIIGYSGNSGAVSSGPHVHIDISNNGKLELNNRANFIDPDAYVKSLFGGQGINVGTKH